MKRHPGIVVAVAGIAYVAAVMQRGSLGVAAVLAASRFDTNASQLGALSVIQLIFYAGMQIPVGILLDRFGAKRLLFVGAISMAAGQLLLANSTNLGQALAGRGLVGFGDAFTFITMLRLVNSWYSGKKAARRQLILSNLGQLGQIVSAIPFAALLGTVGWTPAFSILSLVSLVLSIVVLAFVADTPTDQFVVRHESVKHVLGGLRQSLRNRMVRLGFWTHFTAQSTSTVFILAWGVPYMVNGLGYSHATASSLLTVFVVVSVVYGQFVAFFCTRWPARRHILVYSSIGAILTSVGWMIVAPTPLPVGVVATLFAIIGTGGPTSLVAFDYSRNAVADESLGAANGFINVGGFIAALTMMAFVGMAIDLQQRLECATSNCGVLFSLDHFRTGFLALIAVVGFGLAMLFITSRRKEGIAG